MTTAVWLYYRLPSQISCRKLVCTLDCCVRSNDHHRFEKAFDSSIVVCSFPLPDIQDQGHLQASLRCIFADLVTPCTATHEALDFTRDVCWVQMSGCKPNVHTYSSLIDACSRAAEQDLAIRVYHKAMMDGVCQNLLVYTAAISACRSSQRADLKMAMQIYKDLRRCVPLPQAYTALCAARSRSMPSAASADC